MRVKPTRMELLRVKRRIAFARKGHKLLRERQDALIMELFARMSELRGVRRRVSPELARSYRSIDEACLLQGIQEVDSLSASLASGFSASLSMQRLKGTRSLSITEVRSATSAPSYAGASLPLTDAIVRLRCLGADLFRMVELQLAIKSLAQDIRTVKRRVNALEYIVLPALERTRKGIQQRLEEAARENFIRLKKVKELHHAELLSA